MSELKYLKEATYEFNYNGYTTHEHHYVDNILNLRHRVYNDDLSSNLPQPLNFIGTNETNREIQATLVAERIISQGENGPNNAELYFLLPDVNQYVQIEYKKECMDGQAHVVWGIKYINSSN